MGFLSLDIHESQDSRGKGKPKADCTVRNKQTFLRLTTTKKHF